MMKKALIIANSAGLISDFLVSDVQILRGKGYEVNCACNLQFSGKDSENFFKMHEITLYDIPFPIRDFDIGAIAKSYKLLKEILKQDDYDIIHCHTTIAAVIGRQCARKKRKSGAKVLYTSHGFPFYQGASKLKSKAYFAIEKYYSKFSDAIITICQEDYDNALRMDCPNVYRLHGVGVDVSSFENVRIDVNSKRKALGFNECDKIILSIGEINANKNHKVIIEALALVRELHYIYAICGRELTNSGTKRQLEELAKNLEVDVRFLGYRRDIPEICQCVQLGALPSFKEGLGLAGIEMLASGVPLVASNRQGIKDYVVDGKTGFLCEPHSPESFAEGIRKGNALLNMPLVHENCLVMAEKFDIKNAYEKMNQIYGKFCG